MVEILAKNLKVPVTVKIRCLRTEEETLTLVKRIEAAGASWITVHGRCKEHNKDKVGSANLAIIKKIKETLSIPVFANGGISKFSDVEHALKEAGVDGVMSSESILENPALFANKTYDLDDLALEYFEMCDKYPGEHNIAHVKAHLFKILYAGLTKHTDLRS